MQEQTLGSLREKIHRLARQLGDGPFQYLMEHRDDDEWITIVGFLTTFGRGAVNNFLAICEDPRVIDNFINERGIKHTAKFLRLFEGHMSGDVRILTAEEVQEEGDLKTKLCNQAFLLMQEIFSKMESMWEISKLQCASV